MKVTRLINHIREFIIFYGIWHAILLLPEIITMMFLTIIFHQDLLTILLYVGSVTAVFNAMISFEMISNTNYLTLTWTKRFELHSR
jgi:hypothetical protein